MNMRRTVVQTGWCISALLLGCSTHESLPYPSAWPTLDAAARQGRCDAIDDIYSDRGYAAQGNESELGGNAQFVSLSGLLITGNEYAGRYAGKAHVISSGACQASVELIDPSDPQAPSHLVQTGKTAATGPALAEARSAENALSARNIQFRFLAAADGSLVIQETIRHADVEELFIPTEEIIVLWFRFPKATLAG